MPAERPTVLLARHGETEWNAVGRMQGQLDVPLSPRGALQAQALAARLKSAGIRRIVSSDLVRAKATAEAVAAAAGLEVETDAALREQHLGDWQGITIDEAKARDPELARRFVDRDPDARPPGGETRAELMERSMAALERIAAQGAASPLLLVSHGGVVMSIAYRVLGLPVSAHRRFLMPNTSLTTVVYARGSWFVRTLADVSHLHGPDADSFPFA